MADIDYYFSVLSPYSYLGHPTLLRLARDAGAVIAYRPVKMGALFAANGGVPIAQRAMARQRYRLVELQRWRDRRDLPLNLAPKFFPVDPSLADRCAIVLAESGGDVGTFAMSAMRAVWAEDRDIADRSEVNALLYAAGANATAVLATADEGSVADIYQRNTDAAIAADLPGLPGYVHGADVFWGQDRLDFLRDALPPSAPRR